MSHFIESATSRADWAETALNFINMSNQMDQPKLTRSMSRRFYRFESLFEQVNERLGGHQSDPNLWVFEVAWEVANKGELLVDVVVVSQVTYAFN